MGYPGRTISDWIHDVHTAARERGWWAPYGAEDMTPPRALTADEIMSKLMLVVTELAEAAEEVRKRDFDPRATYYAAPDGGPPALLTRFEFCERTGNYPGPEVKPEGFAIEVADAVIRIFDLVGGMGIDLEAAMVEKRDHNETRGHRHGGKRA